MIDFLAKGTAGFVLLRTKMIAPPCGFSHANVVEQQDGYTSHVFNAGLMKNRKEIRWNESTVLSVTPNMS